MPRRLSDDKFNARSFRGGRQALTRRGGPPGRVPLRGPKKALAAPKKQKVLKLGNK